jgi:hypothetical protein
MCCVRNSQWGGKHKCVMLKTFNEVTCTKLLGIHDGVTIHKRMFMMYDSL